jgi:hypothetical protein
MEKKCNEITNNANVTETKTVQDTAMSLLYHLSDTISQHSISEEKLTVLCYTYLSIMQDTPVSTDTECNPLMVAAMSALAYHFYKYPTHYAPPETKEN